MCHGTAAEKLLVGQALKMVGKHAVHGKVRHWKQQTKHAVWTLSGQYKEHLGFWNGTCSWSALFWSASRHVYQPRSFKEGAGLCQKTCRYQACSLNLPDRRRVDAVGQACSLKHAGEVRQRWVQAVGQVTYQSCSLNLLRQR